jgi:hypothetical protein
MSTLHPFTLIALPDTQGYSDRHPEIFEAQTRWIAANAGPLHVAFVIHEGDITDNNTEREWINARRAMDHLDDVVPYCLNTGNHDQPGWGTEREVTHFRQYFPQERYQLLPCFGGTWNGGMENAWWRFERDGIPYLILCLEFGPRMEVVEWAHRILAANTHRRVILATHCYMYTDNTRVRPGHDWNPHDYKGGNLDGEELWELLVRRHENIFLVLSGHILHSGVGRLTSINDHGSPVHQMLANYQMLGDGGQGWLRLLKIDPLSNAIEVKTYSPFLDRFATDPDNEFIIPDAFRPGFFQK